MMGAVAEWEAVRAQWEAVHGRWLAAVSEGCCPDGHGPLQPVTMHGGEIAGHCAPCQRYWWTDPATADTGWTLDHQPWGPEPGTPWPPMRRAPWP